MMFFPTPTTTTAANSDDNLIKDDKKSDNLLKKYPTHQNSFQQYLRKKLRPKLSNKTRMIRDVRSYSKISIKNNKTSPLKLVIFCRIITGTLNKMIDDLV